MSPTGGARFFGELPVIPKEEEGQPVKLKAGESHGEDSKDGGEQEPEPELLLASGHAQSLGSPAWAALFFLR